MFDNRRFLQIPGKRILNFLQNTVIQTGIVDAIRDTTPNVLTVLNYHRIDDPYRIGLDTFKPNISCTPAGFAEQMDYVRDHYNVIAVAHLAAWLRNEIGLPPHAAIITFDDGYYDNLTYAFPILKARNLPAIIFLTTDYLDADIPFYWDFVAYCFYHTQKMNANLPIFGYCSWTNPSAKEGLMSKWIETLKKLDENEKQQAIQNLAEALHVTVKKDAFSNLYLTWEQVRKLSSNGVEFGSHTKSHPILTRIPLEKVAFELENSIKRIENEINKPVISFAYPNGGPSDFSPEVTKLVGEAGIEAAFTLLPGPVRYSSIIKNPLVIRRVFIMYRDTLPRFILKLSGLSRLLKW